jgi:hypothetical protein
MSALSEQFEPELGDEWNQWDELIYEQSGIN